jgi:ABC-type Fe3+ transport system permease subunit
MENENPYTPSLLPSSASSSTSDRPDPIGLARSIWLTVLIAVVSSFPLAGLIALVFRFPVPFVGIVSGPSGFMSAMFAAFVYGMIGGVLVQVVMGCIGGIVAYLLARRNPQQSRMFILLCGIGSALPGLLLLAMLDWIIGPW